MNATLVKPIATASFRVVPSHELRQRTKKIYRTERQARTTRSSRVSTQSTNQEQTYCRSGEIRLPASEKERDRTYRYSGKFLLLKVFYRSESNLNPEISKQRAVPRINRG